MDREADEAGRKFPGRSLAKKKGARLKRAPIIWWYLTVVRAVRDGLRVPTTR